MKKQLTISGVAFAFLIGVTSAHAETTLNPIENLKKIEANAAKEKARQDAYDKATKPRPPKTKPAPKPAAKAKTGG